MSKERPILFNGAMVRAILAGQKTQTRRVVKPQFDAAPVDVVNGIPSWDAPTNYDGEVQMNETTGAPCPFGKPGDRLWVRETWTPGLIIDGRCSGNSFVRFPDGGQKYKDGAYYRPENYAADEFRADRFKWKPSIHMPRWACRLVLEITDVRVERLQDIGVHDIAAEGIACYPDVNPFHDFEELWTSTGGDWDSNPWVWVIEFKVVTP